MIVSVGWNYPVDYIKALYHLHPKGLFLAVKDGEIVGTAYAYNHTGNLSFFGLAITKPEYRRRGIQKRLVEYRFRHAGERNIGLNSVDSDLGKGIGFVHEDFKSIVVQGYTNHQVLQRIATDITSNINILTISEIEFEKLVKYDAQINTYERPEFLKVWSSGNNVKNYVAVNEGLDIVGYINARPVVGGFLISPCYADDNIIAECLLTTLLRSLSDHSQVTIQFPLPNRAAENLVTKCIVEYTSNTEFRLYTKEVVKTPLHKIFAISCSETMLV
ncbi:holothin acyltransferase-like [Glandiceps talaboti]